MRRFWSFVVLGLSVASASSCEHTGTGTTVGSKTVTNGTFSATIDGTSWTAVGKVIVSEPQGTSLILDASSPTYIIKLTMANLTGFGSATFSLVAAAGNSNVAALTSPTGKWSTANAGGMGTINLTSLSSSRAVGTFTFDAPPSAGSGSTATAHVTGKFDVAF